MRYTKKHEAAWKVLADVLKTFGVNLLFLSVVGMLIDTDEFLINSSVYIAFFFASPILIVLSVAISFMTTISSASEVIKAKNDVNDPGG